MNEILAFTLISALLVVSPGPNGILIIQTMSASTKKFAYINILGLVVATFLHGAFSIFGLSALVLQSSELFMAVKLIGAAYLLYIGTKAIYSSFKKKEISENSSRTTIKKKEGSIKNSFIEGFLTQLLNPKVSMFYLAAFPQFIDFKNAAYFDAFVLVSIHTFFIAIWFYTFANFLVKIKQVSSNSKIGIYIQRITGAIFIFFAVMLLNQEVKTK
ncbi:MAG: homoserine lactone transporter [Arcobacter sp.]|nr:homoserine lactone transporter [Arcobacter sp.]|tara:strand:+ start:10025 stop:10669 length:645 start_codon:yes stop_codon:yes gene_type:complete